VNYTQEELHQWLSRLVERHGPREVAAVMGFETLAEFARWWVSRAEIDDEDIAMLSRKWGIGLMNCGDLDEGER
jgi:hypothetical protein